MISNSLDIDFIHSDIYSRSRKTATLSMSFGVFFVVILNKCSQNAGDLS